MVRRRYRRVAGGEHLLVQMLLLVRLVLLVGARLLDVGGLGGAAGDKAFAPLVGIDAGPDEEGEVDEAEEC